MSGLPDRIKVRPNAAAWRDLGDRAVVLQLPRRTYYGVNPAGKILWSSMVEGTTRQALIDRLVATFGVTPAAAADDVDAFLSQCQEQGLLES